MFASTIINTDSYKPSHYLQLPPGTRRVSAYIEPRGGPYSHVVVFGLQTYLKEHLSKPVTLADIEEAESLLVPHGVPFNREGWLTIVNELGGRLPIEVQALPEGSVLPIRNAVCQVVNTDPRFPWLPTYIETGIQRAIWYGSTVATMGFFTKMMIMEHMKRSCDTFDKLPFMLHDFGARGTTSAEQSYLGGLAHLVNFQGTDTVLALKAAREFYGHTGGPAGFSVPASEHSVLVLWGKQGEKAAYENMLRTFGGAGKIFSVVSDSYDFWNAVDNLWCGELKDQVVNNGGTLVIRPDSGDPVELVPALMQRLSRKFGYTLNSHSMKVLPNCVRVIQGDGMTHGSIDQVLTAMEEHGYSADNIVFGMGGGLLQKLDRDTMKWAMKASAGQGVDGAWYDVCKDPATDHGKRSKPGRLAVVHDDQGDLVTVRADAVGEFQNRFWTVFQDGAVINETSFADVRRRAAEGMERLGKLGLHKAA